MINVSDSDLLAGGQLGQRPIKPASRNPLQPRGSARAKTSTGPGPTPKNTLDTVCHTVAQIII